jgi:F420-0:gamma-glutamyl ligase
MMGEGDEQTPLALLEDLPFVKFQQRNPTDEEIASLRIAREDDIFWPFLRNGSWHKGLLE